VAKYIKIKNVLLVIVWTVYNAFKYALVALIFGMALNWNALIALLVLMPAIA
jgi:hypothetical protein